MEINADSMEIDTDGDGLTDYDDVILGFSPLLRDTDENGVSDADEILRQQVTEKFDQETGRGVTEVSVTLSTNGNISKKVGIVNTYDFDSKSRDVVGLVGIPVEINSLTDFDTATIQFTYDENMLNGVEEENLSILWYDEANDWYHILDSESVIDTENNTVTYVTTHFSTYMLVDKHSWYDAWRENIDYRISQEGDTDPHNFDIAFVVDVSGSMRGTRISNAKTALNNFIDSIYPEDEVALIAFNSNATLVSDFSSDKLVLKNKVQSLYADGNTNVNRGLVEALNTFSKRESTDEKVIVLICDGDVNYVQDTIDKCVDQKIKIYAVNVENILSHANLQKMADLTGGEYYYGSSSKGLHTAFCAIQDSTIDKIDPTDTDGDGLYDIYETAGMRLSNGRVIYTDPTDRDTDKDGLTDFQETGLVYNLSGHTMEQFDYLSIRYFQMKSDPTEKDTDNDGITDRNDKSPWESDRITIELDNKFQDCQYLKITAPDGQIMNGGNQNWWEAGDPAPGGQNVWHYMTNINHRIHQWGCGIVAMTDLEIYLQQQNEDYAFLPLAVPVTYDETTGMVDRDSYMKRLEYNSTDRYPVNNPIHYVTGVIPKNMEDTLSDFLLWSKCPYHDVKWGPFGVENFKNQKEHIASRMEEMLNRNLPVVFAYHTFSEDDEKEIKMYFSVEGLLNNPNDRTQYQTCKSHYMTVIGLYKYLNENGLGYQYVMKVVSWGEVYYIKYDDYCEELSLFSNILSIQ